MLSLIRKGLSIIPSEPPFRLLSRAIVEVAPVSIRRKSRWDAWPRPQYLAGVLAAADQAASEGVASICAVEFGVASGEGLLSLEKTCAAVEKETGISIVVYGFDSGQGLPEVTGDYRDHPDQWRAGDFPMDPERLRKRLSPRTQLVLGDIAHTVPDFIEKVQRTPLGFAAIDVDLYSSTRDALKILSLPSKNTLARTFLYFDDIYHTFTHKFAGELLGIDEFNQLNDTVKIDHWHGIHRARPFHERTWLRQMFIAHDLVALSRPPRNREIRRL